MELDQSKFHLQMDQINLQANPKAKRQIVKAYQSYCESKNISSFPISFASLGQYLTAFTNKLQGSAKSLTKIIGAIKDYCTRQEIPWLSEKDILQLSDLRSNLEFNDFIPTKQAYPLVNHLIRRIDKSLDKNKIKDQLASVVISLGHDGLLRGGEMSSGLKKKNCNFGFDKSKSKQVAIDLKRTKTTRKGNGVTVIIKDHGKYSAVRKLNQWIDTLHIRDKPEAFIFPAWNERTKQFDHSRPMSAAYYRRLVKYAAQKGGLDKYFIRGHSPRAGGATDLFNAGLPYAYIKKFGRWKSDTGLLYYRDDDKIASKVAKAFTRLQS